MWRPERAPAGEALSRDGPRREQGTMIELDRAARRAVEVDVCLLGCERRSVAGVAWSPAGT
jgi:hypothetical protein